MSKKAEASADAFFMSAALKEARLGLGRTHPNPAVGAVVVKNGKIIARGFHAKAGTPHAEVVALTALKKGAATGATLYVTLEPCSHFGRTPPCAPAVVDSGITRVVYASADPNPKVNGRGHRILVAGGLEVKAGVLRDEADLLNRPYLKAVRTGLPWVTLKAGITLDGKIATASGDSKWVTSESSRDVVHRIRDVVDAIVVGANTVIADNPLLTTRVKGSPRQVRNATRVVIDPNLRTKPSAKVFGPGTVLVTSPRNAAKAAAQKRKGVEVWAMPKSLTALLERLVDAGFLHVLLEGGAGVYESFIEEGLVDEFVLFMAPKVAGGDALGWSGPRGLGVKSMARAVALEFLHVEQLGSDLMITARPTQKT